MKTQFDVQFVVCQVTNPSATFGFGDRVVDGAFSSNTIGDVVWDLGGQA
jgi:hypothetical protein